MNRLTSIGGLILTLAVASCLTVGPAPKLAPAADDQQAKQFAPTADTANVYIHRTGDALGAAVEFQVLIDGQPVAALGPNTYQLVVVTPGDHQLQVKAGLSSASLGIRVAAGKNAFYESEPTPGRPTLQPQVSWVPIEAMGKLMINQSRRAALLAP